MKFLRKTSTRERAFTMLEVLIAVSTFAIVLAAINTVFYGALRLRNKTTQLTEAALPLQQAVAIIRHDLRGIVPPGGTLTGALKSGADSSSGALAGLSQQTGPEIYTGTGIVNDAAPWGDVQKVTYFLRDPTNRATATGRDLIRAITRNLLATTAEPPTEQWLMGDVERIQFFFYSGTEWRDSWDSTTEESALPKAIKVQIQLAETDAAQRAGQRLESKPPIELLVPIVVQARTNQTRNTGGQP